MRKNIVIILLFCVLMLAAGCSSSNYLLDNNIDPNSIDKIQFVQAMGNPTYGADSRIITERSEIASLVDAFNGAVVGDEIGHDVSLHSTILFFSGDIVAHQFFFNGNDTERVLLNSRFYSVRYPGLTPFELYLESTAEVIVVDENLVEIERPVR